MKARWLLVACSGSQPTAGPGTEAGAVAAGAAEGEDGAAGVSGEVAAWAGEPVVAAAGAGGDDATEEAARAGDWTSASSWAAEARWARRRRERRRLAAEADGGGIASALEPERARGGKPAPAAAPQDTGW